MLALTSHFQIIQTLLQQVDAERSEGSCAFGTPRVEDWTPAAEKLQPDAGSTFGSPAVDLRVGTQPSSMSAAAALQLPDDARPTVSPAQLSPLVFEIADPPSQANHFAAPSQAAGSRGASNGLCPRAGPAPASQVGASDACSKFPPK